MSGTLSNIHNNTSFALHLHAEAMAGLQEQAYNGSRINRASDDPSAAYRVLGLKSQKGSLENYMDNISQTVGTLEISSFVTEEMASAISKTKTTLTQALSGTYSEADRQIFAKQVNDTLEQIVSLANTDHMGQYIFGGSNTSSAPYAVQRTNGEITNVTYQGSLQNRDIEVAPGVQSEAFYAGDGLFRSDSRDTPVFLGSSGATAGTGTSSVKGDVWLTVTDDGSGSYDLSIDDGVTKVNVAAAADIANIAVKNSAGEVLYVDATNISCTGVEMVRLPGTYDIFSTLINIRDLLKNQRDLPGSTVLSLINESAESLEEIKNLLVEKQVAMGTKINFLDTLKGSLENVKFGAEDEASVLQEADIAQIAIDISSREMLYQMSLSVAGKLMSMSLLDFLG